MKSMLSVRPSLSRSLSLSVRSACSSQSKSAQLVDGRLTSLGAAIEAERCLLCVDAPCAKACPADTQPDKFLRQLRFENPLGAAETVLDNNPLGGVCGTVCPVSRLCEKACTRSAVDGPVKIGAVQRYLHDLGMREKLPSPPVPAPLPSGHRTAVIGAGPAGLAAARELARKGSQVTVFEKRSLPGGALRYALSPLRVPHELVDEEVRRIQEMGVRFVCDSEVSDAEALLRESEFDAVFVSPGLQASRAVTPQRVSTKNNTSSNTNNNANNSTNSTAFTVSADERLLGALHFLESANTDAALATRVVKGRAVVVIGGGSVAMDCAITAKALGAHTVHIAARESLLAMPADEEEVKLAQEIGAVFHPLSDVVEMRDDDVVVLSTRSENNSSNAQKPLRSELSAAAVIVAAGQLLDETGKRLLRVLDSSAHKDVTRNLAEADKTPANANNAQKKVFYFGGDAVRGGGDTVVQAVADGKRAAAEILPGVPAAPRERLSLATEFVGIRFENPFTLSSSPVTNSAEMIARAYDAGFSGAYYKTLNREDKFSIAHPSPRLGAVHHSGQRQGGLEVGIQNMEQISDRPLADNLKDIEWLRVNYPNKVTAVSIMGYCDEDWDYLARAAEGAGAHLLELNFSCPQMARSDAGHHVGQQFDLIERYTRAAKRAVKIPVVAKLTPNITDMVPAALAAKNGGADAISAINTLKSISHVDLDMLVPTPTIQGHSSVSGFSGKGCRPIGLRFVSELARDKRLQLPISGMGGIYTWKDAAEYIALGASNLQVTTSVMQHGVRVVEDMIDGLQRYLEKNRIARVEDFVGRANRAIIEPGQLDIKTEVVSVIDESLCIGCGACEVACRDGAAHAISLVPSTANINGSPAKRVAKVDRKECVGCKLCQFVCPVGAVSFETRPRIERPRFSK